MPNSGSIKGIRIRTLNQIMLFLSLLFFAAVFYTTVMIWREYSEFVKITDSYVSWERAAHQVHTGSDKLTEQSRLYAQTRKRKFADNYFYELDSARSREKATEFLSKNHLHPEKNDNLQKALLLSNALSTREIYAIRLVAEAVGEDLATFPPLLRTTRLSAADRALSPHDKIEKARQILFSSEYQQSKNGIIAMLSELIDQNLLRTRVEQEEQTRRLEEVLVDQRVMLIALCILNVLTFAMIIILIVKPLQVYLRCIRDDKMLQIIGAYEFKHLALTYNDIFALKERHDKMLQHKAEHDPLTGLLNRSAFDSLRHLLACDTGPVAFLLVDVDKFKSINDTYGHETGDATLKRVADLLQHSFRADDLCIRLGGDEFAIVLRGEMPGFEQIIKDKIRAINDALQNPEDRLPKLSISVGVAVSKAGFTETLYQDADTALYRVKEGGRCGCQFYHSNS